MCVHDFRFGYYSINYVVLWLQHSIKLSVIQLNWVDLTACIIAKKYENVQFTMNLNEILYVNCFLFSVESYKCPIQLRWYISYKCYHKYIDGTFKSWIRNMRSMFCSDFDLNRAWILIILHLTFTSHYNTIFLRCTPCATDFQCVTSTVDMQCGWFTDKNNCLCNEWILVCLHD